MSSDPSNRQDRFRLTAAVTIGALLLAAVGLTVANTLQGPRLLAAQINPGATVEGPRERLVLRVDQTVAELTTDQVIVRVSGASDQLSPFDPSSPNIFPTSVNPDGSFSVAFEGLTLQMNCSISSRLDRAFPA